MADDGACAWNCISLQDGLAMGQIASDDVNKKVDAL